MLPKSKVVGQLDAEHFALSSSLGDVLQQIPQLLTNTDADCAEPYWIVCSVLGIKRSQLDKFYTFDATQLNRLERILVQRRSGMPLDYILGCSNFYGLDIAVDCHVLIPKQETELLAEYAINAINKNMEHSCSVLDLCTGSGCISVAIGANARKAIKIVLSDISCHALAVARDNMTRLVGDKCEWVALQGNMFENLSGKFDFIVCNPPYIASSLISSLTTEVNKQPHIALDGGMDGLCFYRQIAKLAPNFLKKQAKLFLEIGYDQGQTVKSLLVDSGLCRVQVIKDYSGNDRIVVAERGI